MTSEWVTTQRIAIEQFLYREARLLDERRLDEWLGLFTDDGVYWIPFDPKDDPLADPSILYDDSELRFQRVCRLQHGPAYSQMPPSTTLHVVTNIEILGGDESSCEVSTALVVHEVRAGDHRQHGLGYQHVWPARCTYMLRRAEEKFMIDKKTVLLASRALPVPNLTFIL